MEPRLAAFQAPVLADRRLGQRAARADGEQRERAQRLVLGRRRRLEDVLRDHALGEVVEPLEAAPSGDHELRRCPTAPRAPSSPASSSTCRRPRRSPRSRASRAAPRRGSAPAPVRTAPGDRGTHGRASPSDRALHHACGSAATARSGAATPRAPSTRRCARARGAAARARDRTSRCARRASAGARGRRSRSSRAAPPRGGESRPRRRSSPARR